MSKSVPAPLDPSETSSLWDVLLILSNPCNTYVLTEFAAPGRRITRLYASSPLADSESPTFFKKSWHVANHALAQARKTNRHLLVAWEGTSIRPDAVATLADALQEDPYFGFAVPRLIEGEKGSLLNIGISPSNASSEGLSRRVLSMLPKRYITPEVLVPCFLIRNSVVANFESFDEGFISLEGALLEYMCRARRAGFSTITVNSAGAWVQSKEQGYIDCSNNIDLQSLYEKYPDAQQVRSQVPHSSFVLEERLLGKVFSQTGGGRRSMLIDAYGVTPIYNGTTEAASLLLDAFYQHAENWDFSLMCSKEACEFHGFKKRYQGWRIIESDSGQPHTIVFRVNQPWSIADLARAHQQAFFNVMTILDTISWDIKYGAPPGLNEVWEFCARYMDGIVYISSFTANRFRKRFPLSPSVKECPQLLSMHPDEYRKSIGPVSISEDYLLVIGNNLDHKDVPRTASLFAEAFPYERTRVLGPAECVRSQIEAFPSGRIAPDEIDRLFAQAKIVIFPSYYEGFGFPILKGLAFGKTVVVRHSLLVEELAAHYRGPGQICVFSNPSELFEIVGRILYGEEVPVLPIGTALNPEEEPLRWENAAKHILSFFETVAADVNIEHWRERDRILRIFANGK